MVWDKCFLYGPVKTLVGQHVSKQPVPNNGGEHVSKQPVPNNGGEKLANT